MSMRLLLNGKVKQSNCEYGGYRSNSSFEIRGTKDAFFLIMFSLLARNNTEQIQVVSKLHLISQPLFSLSF